MPDASGLSVLDRLHGFTLQAIGDLLERPTLLVLDRAPLLTDEGPKGGATRHPGTLEFLACQMPVEFPIYQMPGTRGNLRCSDILSCDQIA
jgi:hypothetical protein